jgi:hypothetical protein
LAFRCLIRIHRPSVRGRRNNGNCGRIWQQRNPPDKFLRYSQTRSAAKLHGHSVWTGVGDYVDLTNISFADHPTVKYFQKTGQLIVSDPHTKVSDTITLVGNYKPSDLILTNDGSGGVLVTANGHGNGIGAGAIAASVNSSGLDALHETQILGSPVFDTHDGWLL